MLGIDWKILIGQIINFAILLWILKRFAYQPFLSLLEKRRLKIEEGIRKSEEAEKSLERIKILSQKIKEKSEKEARELIIEAELKAKVRAQEIIAQALEERNRSIELAKKMMEKEREREMKKREEEIMENVFLLAEKLLKEKIDRRRDEKIIAKILTKLK